MTGKIILDEEFYEGTDRYSDGDVEDELLALVSAHDASEFRHLTEEKLSWPVLYHLSPFRENIVEWLPIEKSDKVLEIGSGCGAITGALARKAGSVISLDLSKKRSTINANRLKDVDNVTIKIGNFMDIEHSLDTDFDAILLIGVFEYARGYVNTKNPYEDFLGIILKHLKKGGRVYIAIENRFGLKYFAGCSEDHAGRYFEGLEGYPNKGVAKTFTRNALEKILDSCNVSEYSFYYPYPDYKFPHTIFSDEILPKKGELHDNIRNFDRERMILMDEGKVFDTIIEDGEFPLFSNSYMVVIGPGLKEKMIKYSVDRAEEYGICTTIEADENGRIVTKRAVNEASEEHVANIEKAYKALCDRFEGSSISFNRLKRKDEKTLSFEFLSGRTLEEVLDDAVAAGDKEGFLALLGRYKEVVSYHEEIPVTDYDLIFQNIIVNDDAWSVIDYEWTVFEHIPSDEIVNRALWCYLQGNAGRNIIKEWCGLNENFESVIKREREFQKKVQGDHLALSEIRHKIGKAALSLDYLLAESGEYKGTIQIYRDEGQGFSEGNSYFADSYARLGKEITLRIPLSKGLKKLRIDPGNRPAFVIVRSADIDGEDILARVLKKDFSKRDFNGKRLGADGFVFTDNDPHFAFLLPSGKENALLTITLFIEQISADVAARMK